MIGFEICLKNMKMLDIKLTPLGLLFPASVKNDTEEI